MLWEELFEIISEIM